MSEDAALLSCLCCPPACSWAEAAVCSAMGAAWTAPHTALCPQPGSHSFQCKGQGRAGSQGSRMEASIMAIGCRGGMSEPYTKCIPAPFWVSLWFKSPFLTLTVCYQPLSPNCPLLICFLQGGFFFRNSSLILGSSLTKLIHFPEKHWSLHTTFQGKMCAAKKALARATSLNQANKLLSIT